MSKAYQQRKKEYYRIVDQFSEEYDFHQNPFIKLTQIVKDYDLEDFIMRAVDHVNLEMDQHEYVAIVGPSGAGKTTLLHLLAGLIKATEGQIYLSFIDITPMQEETLTTFRIFNVGVVFQNYNLISSLTALENIMFPMELTGFSPVEAEIRALELLTKVGLKNRKEHLPVQLSAGEQQRVAIARALAIDPPIIIADEPTANLDKKNSQFIGSLFEDLRQAGKTIIVATHDDNLIQHAHRILTMEQGKIIEDQHIKDITYTEESTETADHNYVDPEQIPEQEE